MNAYTPTERLRTLVDVFCTDSISGAELRELETLLCADAQAQQFHAAYCRMHAELLLSLCAEHVAGAEQALKPPAAPQPPIRGLPDEVGGEADGTSPVSGSPLGDPRVGVGERKNRCIEKRQGVARIDG